MLIAYQMANVNQTGHGLSAYRRDEREEMQAGPPMDLSFKKATKMDGNIYKEYSITIVDTLRGL